MGFVTLYTIPLIAFSIFHCHPTRAAFNISPQSKCLNPLLAIYTNGICNILVDICLIALIAPRIWSLKMAKKQKTLLILLVMSDWIVILAAIIRMVRLIIFGSKDADITCS